MIDCHVILSLSALRQHRSNNTRALLSEQRVKSSRILGMWWDISTTYSVIIYNRAHLVVFCLQIHSPMSSNMATTDYWCWDDRGTQNFMLSGRQWQRALRYPPSTLKLNALVLNPQPTRPQISQPLPLRNPQDPVILPHDGEIPMPSSPTHHDDVAGMQRTRHASP